MFEYSATYQSFNELFSGFSHAVEPLLAACNDIHVITRLDTRNTATTGRTITPQWTSPLSESFMSLLHILVFQYTTLRAISRDFQICSLCRK